MAQSEPDHPAWSGPLTSDSIRRTHTGGSAALVFAAALFLSLVSACGSETPEPTSNPATSSGTSSTAEPPANTTPTTTPDDSTGGTIAYHSGEGISIIQPDGTGSSQFNPTVDGNRPHHPDWSPDGSMLAFVVDNTDGTSDIWVAGADGANARTVVDCEAPCVFAEDPSWSSDGTRLAYWTNGPTETTQDIRVVEVATGTTMLTVTGDNLTGAVNPKWSRDDSQLAVEVQTFAQQGSDIVMTDSAIGIIDLTSDSPSTELITPPEMFAGYPDWNRTGDRLVFQAGNGDPFSFTGEPPELFTIRPDGTDMTQLTTHADGAAWVALPDWTSEPDERILVTLITSENSYTLGSVDVNGAVTVLVDATGEPIEGAHPRMAPG